jgi:methylglutaconyl-CoA hydratase
MASYLEIERADKVVTVRLNRPDKHNAFDEQLIAELTQAFRDLAADRTARVVVLTANGPSFSAGADLGWMKRMSTLSRAENERDSLLLADLMAAIDGCPKPVIALVQGAAFGGGVGLVACCDIAIASTRATFSLSEVRLGLIPAVISPYVAAAIGPRACRRYFLTAERFDAETAERLGLVQRVVEPEALGVAGDEIVEHLLKGGPNALAAAKDLIRRVSFAPLDQALRSETAARIAETRATDEGKEGIAAFLEKRKPNWS